MKIAVIDDEEIICSQIDEFIMNHLKKKNEKNDISVYFSGEGFCSALKNESFDLIFLDIELKGCSGIDVSNFIRMEQNDYTTQIVYVTGKSAYDRLLFDFQPFGFIAKPVTEAKIDNILDKFRKIYDKGKTTFRYNLNHTDCWVKLNDVIYFESEDRKVKMHMCGNADVITFYMKMTDIYERVKSGPFLFIHKSFIVNERYITEFLSDFVRVSNGDLLPISRLRRKEVLKRQMEIEMGEF